jgi:hypothetical protein
MITDGSMQGQHCLTAARNINTASTLIVETIRTGKGMATTRLTAQGMVLASKTPGQSRVAPKTELEQNQQRYVCSRS